MALVDQLASAQPQYRRGDTGQTPGQQAPLPQGEATGLNVASQGIPTAQVNPLEAAAAAIPDPTALLQSAPPAYSPPRDGGPESFIFAPTSDPQTPVTQGTSAYRRVAAPPEAYHILPVLDAAAQDPSPAGQNARILRDLITFHMGQRVV